MIRTDVAAAVAKQNAQLGRLTSVDAARVEAYEAMARELRPQLWRLARVLSGSPHIADDLVQEVLMEMFARWEQLNQSEVDVGSYARRSIFNRNVSAHRRVHRAREVLLAEPPQVSVSPTLERPSSSLLTALRGLPERQRAVLVLRYLEDASDAAIAADLRTTRVAVRLAAMRGLRQLGRDPMVRALLEAG